MIVVFFFHSFFPFQPCHLDLITHKRRVYMVRATAHVIFIAKNITQKSKTVKAGSDGG